MPIAVATALTLGVSLAACTGPNTPPLSSSTSSGPAYVTDGTVTVSIVTDPGALDPQTTIVAGIFEMSGYAYDSIVGIDPSGKVVSQLAKSWTYEGTTATFVINDGVTCSDGSKLTAKTVVDNITWMEDPNNASPFLGTFLPAGATATADDATNTVTLKLAGPSPFLLQSLANVPIVCDAGLADRTKLASATLGSGPYQLTEAVPSDHYTYQRRDGYTWGPGGATTATVGLPKTIVVKIVPNESTEVNLLLSGEVNIATTTGPDAARAEAAGLKSVDVPAVLGLTWYNHAAGHPTSDPAVRRALTQAVDLDQLAKVITGGTGSRATQMAVIPPTTCNFDSATGNIVGFDAAGAAATLTQAGYTKGADGKFTKGGKPLAISFMYDSALGATGQAAAELAVSQWQAVGFTIDTKALETSQASQVLFGTGDWDVAWEPVNVNSPDQFMSMLSGPGVTDGGANFSSIANSGYGAATADAMTKQGAEACTAFQTAEKALFTGDDIVTWAVRPNKIYLNGVEYQYVGRTQVTALRVLAS